MQEYTVEVPEIHIATYVVEAHTSAGAVQAIWDGEGEQTNSVYSHTIEAGGDIPAPRVNGKAWKFPSLTGAEIDLTYKSKSD